MLDGVGNNARDAPGPLMPPFRNVLTDDQIDIAAARPPHQTRPPSLYSVDRMRDNLPPERKPKDKLK